MESIASALSLTEKEAQVYSLLCERGSTSAGELIKASGMYRAAVYDILERLIEKGLIGFVNFGKIREFNVLPISTARQKLDEEIEKIKNKQETLDGLAKQLNRPSTSDQPQVIVLKGRKGLQSVLNDVIENNSEWHVFGAQGQFKKSFYTEYKIFHSKRARRKILVKIIYNSTVRPEQREKELELIEIRYVDKKFDTPATTYVYGNSVAIIIWSNPVYVMWIKSKEVAKSYENQFQILWKNAKR